MAENTDRDYNTPENSKSPESDHSFDENIPSIEPDIITTKQGSENMETQLITSICWKRFIKQTIKLNDRYVNELINTGLSIRLQVVSDTTVNFDIK